jgi:hypothetical protein
VEGKIVGWILLMVLKRIGNRSQDFFSLVDDAVLILGLCGDVCAASVTCGRIESTLVLVIQGLFYEL